MSKKYIAEFVGTFALSFVVLLATATTAAPAVAVPVIAGLTLGLFVYTIGRESGAHINPAVTLGLLAVKKISTKEAGFYVIAQIFAAAVAVVVSRAMGFVSPEAVSLVFDSQVFLAEVLGTFFFAFGIAAVVYGRVSDAMSGVVIGASLTLGIIIASLSGSLGILNPAVAFAVNAINAVYMIAPIVGATLGFAAYRYITK